MTQDDQRPSVGEQLEQLTGYDEAKITARFGHPPLSGPDEVGLTGSMQLRALIFAHKLHSGTDDAASYEEAMKLTMKQVNDYFADEADDVDMDEPVSAEGNAG